MAELTSLTLESFNELSGKGKIKQVSEILTVVTPYGPIGGITDNILRESRQYSEANAYYQGLTRQIEVFVTPVVFYHISE